MQTVNEQTVIGGKEARKWNSSKVTLKTWKTPQRNCDYHDTQQYFLKRPKDGNIHTLYFVVQLLICTDAEPIDHSSRNWAYFVYR